jgi:hypothetical protein
VLLGFENRDLSLADDTKEIATHTLLEDNLAGSILPWQEPTCKPVDACVRDEIPAHEVLQPVADDALNLDQTKCWR